METFTKSHKINNKEIKKWEKRHRGYIRMANNLSTFREFENMTRGEMVDEIIQDQIGIFPELKNGLSSGWMASPDAETFVLLELLNTKIMKNPTSF